MGKSTLGRSALGRSAYMHTSAAPVLPQQERRRKRNMGAPEPEGKHVIRERIDLRMFYVIITVAVIVFFAALYLIEYAQIEQLNTFIDETNTMNQQISLVGKSIEKNLVQSIDIEDVKKQAFKLGLQPPADYQTVIINVPKDSYSVQFADSVAEEKKSKSIFDRFKFWEN